MAFHCVGIPQFIYGGHAHLGYFQLMDITYKTTKTFMDKSLKAYLFPFILGTGHIS